MGIFQKLIGLVNGAPNESTTPIPTVAATPPTQIGHDSEASAGLTQSAAEPAVQPSLPKQKAEPRAPGVKKVVLDEAGLSILDLRELPLSRFRIVGSAFWVTDSGRYKHGGSDYLLVREPKNKWDANAVAVYGKGREVGHLTEAKAAAFAPILDEPAFDAYRVGGAPADNSIRMWVDVPAIPNLRAFAKSLDKGRG
jgi:hypothetical protein